MPFSVSNAARRRKVLAAFIAVCWGFVGWAAAGDPSCIEVIDGDTLRVAWPDREEVIHLWGVDTPQLDQPRGEEARETLEELALGKRVSLTDRGRSAEGRLASVAVGETDCATVLAQRGLAWVSAEGGSSDDYALQVVIARSGKVGLWADDGAIHPAVWRDRQPRPAATPTAVPRRKTSLSELAAKIHIEDGVVINKAATARAAGSPTEARVVPIEVPDSEYGRCIGEQLQAVQTEVNSVRAALADNALPENPEAVGALTAICRQIENHGRTIRTCGDAGHSFVGADWAAESAVNAYSHACGYALDHKDVASALGAIAKGDSEMQEAADLFAEGIEQQADNPVDSPVDNPEASR